MNIAGCNLKTLNVLFILEEAVMAKSKKLGNKRVRTNKKRMF